MYIRCWQCSEELDSYLVEAEIYGNLIKDLRKRMCDNSIDDKCDLWWRHEDCMAIGNIIQELKEKL